MVIHTRHHIFAALLAVTIATAALIEPCFAPPSTAQDTADSFKPQTSGDTKGNRLSAIVADALLKAQKEDAAVQLDAALVDARKADGAARTNYEKLKVDQILTQIYMDMNDTNNAALAAEGAADLPGIPANELPDIVTNACILATAVHDYDKAANYARQMQSLKLGDERSKRIIDTALSNAPKPAVGPGAPH